MKKTMAWTVLFVTLLVGAAACKDNVKATEACKDNKSADSCDKCCHTNGANGYKYLGDGCTCLGG